MSRGRAAVVALGVPFAAAMLALAVCPYIPLDGDYSDTVEAEYDGLTVDVPASDAVTIMRSYCTWALRQYVMPDDPAVTAVAEHLTSSGLTGYDLAESARKWVHANITYVRDSASHGTGDWWQTPYETLRLGTGDCEDQAILLASILAHMGFDVAMIHSYNHVSVGVAIDGAASVWSTVEVDGVVYLLSDPTSGRSTGRVTLDVDAVYPLSSVSTEQVLVTVVFVTLIAALVAVLCILWRMCETPDPGDRALKVSESENENNGRCNDCRYEGFRMTGRVRFIREDGHEIWVGRCEDGFSVTVLDDMDRTISMGLSGEEAGLLGRFLLSRTSFREASARTMQGQARLAAESEIRRILGDRPDASEAVPAVVAVMDALCEDICGGSGDARV